MKFKISEDWVIYLCRWESSRCWTERHKMLFKKGNFINLILFCHCNRATFLIGTLVIRKRERKCAKTFLLAFFFSSGHSSEINAVMVTGNCWQCSISWIHYKLLKISIVLKLFLNFRERKVFLWLLGRCKAVQHQYRTSWSTFTTLHFWN